MKVGVLALQGGFDPHLRTLKRLGADASLVRTWDEISSVDALVLPGGESTTLGKLLTLQGLMSPLRERILQGLPVFGTCAGMILMAQDTGRDQPLLSVMDIDVKRNAYGRQTESFETTLTLAGSQELPAVFIRAPQVSRLGPAVQVLAEYERVPVCVRQGNRLAASFHPELTASPVLHDYFLSLV